MIVSIDVDAQRTFSPLCPNELPVAQGDEIVAELNAQAALAQARVMSKDAHNPNAVWVAPDHARMLQPLAHANADISWVRHAEVGTPGFELLPGLPAPEDYDFLVYKGVENHLHPYGACYHDLGERISTGLIEWLKVRQAHTLIVGGLATDYCVKTTVLQLCRAHSWRVWVNLAACRGIAPDTTAQAIEAMQEAGARIANNAQAIGLGVMMKQ